MTQLHATNPLSSTTVTLISQLGHDINNLFSVILGGLSLLNDELRADRLDAELQAVLDDALSATHDASQVIEKLTAWAGRQITQPEAVDLNRVASEVANEARGRLHPGIALTLECAEPRALAWVDPAKLAQCLHMLLDNAEQAISGAGSVQLVVHPGDVPSITLTDDGTTIGQDCFTCHGMLAIEEEDPQILADLEL